MGCPSLPEPRDASFVGFDPDEVQKLVAQLRGAAEDLGNMARQADQALDRVRTFVPAGPNLLEIDIGRLRGCGTTIGEMSADIQKRLAKFREDQRFEAAQQWAERSLSGVSEGLERTRAVAKRWQPGYWVRGKWIPGRLVVDDRWAAAIDDDFMVAMWSRRIGVVPGRFGPSSWVEGSWVDDVAKQRAGRFLGRGMNALDVGLSAWGEWGKRSDLAGPERLAHAGWAGLTEGVGSAAGGSVGYVLGGALVVALGANPVGAAVVVAGIGGAILGSEGGKRLGGLVKEGGKALGRTAVSGGKAIAKGVGKGAKRVLGMFS